MRRKTAPILMALLLACSAAAQTPTSTVLSVPAPTVVSGPPVTLTASVTPAVATGKVTFYDGVNFIGVAELANGQALFRTAMLEFGPHALHAVYQGNTPFQKSTSAVVSLTIRTLPGAGFAEPVASVMSPGVLTDFNGDGNPDVIRTVTDASGATILSVLLASADGTFPAQDTPGSAPQGLTVGDFNGDGKADLLQRGPVQPSPGGGLEESVEVLFGNGDGTFRREGQPTFIGQTIYQTFTGDFDHDGRLDLGVAYKTAPGQLVPVFQIRLGNGDGTFPVWAGRYQGGGFTFGWAGDLNNDGKGDFFGKDMGVSVFLGNGTGGFTYFSTADIGTLFRDINNDGKLDSVRIGAVALGNGDGHFQPPLTWPVSGSPDSLAVGDFDGDGKPDLVTNDANGGIHILLGNGDGTFQAPKYFPSSSKGPVSVFDVNRDGVADVLQPGVVWLGLKADSKRLSAVQGSGQSAAIGQQFAQHLQARLTEPDGRPGGNIPVTFTAATSGPSGTFPSGTAAVVVTDAEGLATAPPFTANMIAGTHRVSVTTASALPAEFVLTNLTIPTNDSVSPNAGAGIAGVFTFRYSHVNGHAYLRQMFASLNDSAYGKQGCTVNYYQYSSQYGQTKQLYLNNDTGDGWLGPVAPGAAGTLTNSRCTLNAGGSSISGSGDTLALTLALTFKPAFAGTRGIYMYAVDSAGQTTTAIELRGSWTVPSGDTTPPVTIATIEPPANSAGWNNSNVNVSLNASDNAGGSGVKQLYYSLSGAQNPDTQTVAGKSALVTVSSEGSTTITFFAEDQSGNREQRQTRVIRIDKTRPAISGMPANCVLWPPNHGLVQVAIVSVSDNLSGAALFNLRVTTNEPSPSQEPDIVVTGRGLQPRTLQLRAERLGAGKGRVYTISANASDIAGNSDSAVSTCTVPHDQR